MNYKSSNGYPRWTPEEDEQLFSALKNKITDDDLSKALGRTKGSIGARRRYIKSPRAYRKPHQINHGKSGGYVRDKCRCVICTTWSRNYYRKYENRHKRPRQKSLKGVPNKRYYSSYGKNVWEQYKKDRQAKESKVPKDRNGTPWTTAEDAIALDSSLTTLERGYILHRSPSSVSARASRIRKKILMENND